VLHVAPLQGATISHVAPLQGETLLKKGKNNEIQEDSRIEASI
jgi:hypothetical protein